MEIPTCNLSASTSTSTRQLVDATCHVRFWWIWSLEPWTVSVRVPSVNCSGQTTLCLGRQVLEIIGPRVTTLKVLSWLIQCWTLSEKRLRAVIACRASSFATLLVEALVLAWEHCWFPKCARNTQIALWRHSQWFHPQKCQTQWWSPTMQSWAFTSWWRTLMSRSCWTTRLCTTFASVLWSWLPQLMVTWTIWCLLQWAEWLAACVSLDSWTATCARLQWTWCRSHVCTSSWPASHHWLLVALSSIGRWPSQSLPNRCLVTEHRLCS